MPKPNKLQKKIFGQTPLQKAAIKAINDKAKAARRARTEEAKAVKVSKKERVATTQGPIYLINPANRTRRSGIADASLQAQEHVRGILHQSFDLALTPL